MQRVGEDLIRKTWQLPKHLGAPIRSIVWKFRGGELWYKQPSILEAQTLAYLLVTNQPDWGGVAGSHWLRLEPRSKIQLAADRVICPNFWSQRHELTREIEEQVKERIRINDLFLEGSLEQQPGEQLDSSTAGRLLLLKKIMNNDYDPILGITCQEAQQLPISLVCHPLRRLKRDLDVCGLYDLARELK